MLITTLEQIGLSEKQAKVYLACLKLGPAPVRLIARETGLNRGTCYDLLKGLMAWGLVSYYHKNTHKYFVAEDPQNLQEVISSQEEKLARAQQEIAKIIPELKSIFDNAGDKPVVKYYEGLTGVKTILKDLLQTLGKTKKEREYFVYSAADIRNYLYKAYPGFTEERIKMQIRVHVIAIGSGGRLCGLDKRLWLSREKSSPTYILIYQNKVALISVNKQKVPIGVLIEDEGLYRTHILLFQKMWEMLKILRIAK
ncbi:MAG: helix-turn-helix domain-containing protein [bacterium]|nr:helix-turn-helix domain-containing protein [bacterium]